MCRQQPPETVAAVYNSFGARIIPRKKYSIFWFVHKQSSSCWNKTLNGPVCAAIWLICAILHVSDSSCSVLMHSWSSYHLSWLECCPVVMCESWTNLGLHFTDSWVCISTNSLPLACCSNSAYFFFLSLLWGWAVNEQINLWLTVAQHTHKTNDSLTWVIERNK